MHFNRLLTLSVSAFVFAAYSRGEADQQPVEESVRQATLPQNSLIQQRDDDSGCHYRDAGGTTGTGLWVFLNAFRVSDQCRLLMVLKSVEAANVAHKDPPACAQCRERPMVQPPQGAFWPGQESLNSPDIIGTTGGAASARPAAFWRTHGGEVPSRSHPRRILAQATAPPLGGRMSTDSHHPPRDTREFVAVWNEAVEEHLVRQLAQALPDLARDISLADSAHAAAMARPLVRALRLSALSGDAAAAVRYLADTANRGTEGEEPGSRG
jgi:hypothetical protein